MKILTFMPNGCIRRMQRHGLKADGVYGKVDNLPISYEGNRISSVLEDAVAVTQNVSLIHGLLRLTPKLCMLHYEFCIFFIQFAV